MHTGIKHLHICRNSTQSTQVLKKDIHTYLNSLTVCIRDENMNMFIPIYHTCSPIHVYTMNSMLNVRIENTCTYLYTTCTCFILHMCTHKKTSTGVHSSLPVCASQSFYLFPLVWG